MVLQPQLPHFAVVCSALLHGGIQVDNESVMSTVK